MVGLLSVLVGIVQFNIHRVMDQLVGVFYPCVVIIVSWLLANQRLVLMNHSSALWFHSGKFLK